MELCHTEYMEKVKVETHTLGGGRWIIGWLFTIGFLHLSAGKGALALILWPYYLGVYFGVPVSVSL